MERSSAEVKRELDRVKEQLGNLERDVTPSYTPGSSISGVPEPEALPTPEGLGEIDRLRARIAELERAYGEALAAGR